MPRLVREAQVAAPPSQVFDLLTDFERAARILPGVQESVVLTPGPVRVGSRVRERREVKGRVRDSEFVVTAHEPARRFWMDVYTDGKKAGEGGFDLVPAGEGTRLRYTLDVELPGLMKLLAPLAGPVIAKEMEGDLDAIRRAVETP